MISNAFSTFENALTGKNGSTLISLSLVFPNRVTIISRTKILSETPARFKPYKIPLMSETERDDNQPDRSDKN